MMKSNLAVLNFVIMLVVVAGCASNDDTTRRATLADIDTSETLEDTSESNSAQSKSREEVLNAYRQYVTRTKNQGSSRQQALTRLAQLELELTNALIKDERLAQDQDTVINASLERTIQYLETRLREYPDAKDNDLALYQLAQARDRTGRYQESLTALDTLVSKYPQSEHYPEAQFRLGESAFAKGDYISAEDAYTEVLLSPSSDRYYEKSLFKRGWTRYKQQLYREALDDYIAAVEYHKFGDASRLSGAEKTQFEEYFRAVGLSFAYLRGQTGIKEYFADHQEFPYIFRTYATVSDIYLKQERFSDAADILSEYTQAYSGTVQTALAEQRTIEAWREGGFTSRLFAAIEQFYQRYQPTSAFWKTQADDEQKKAIQDSLRTYVSQISTYYHDRYSQKSKASDFKTAKIWYERYLTHFKPYANQDNIYTLFGELLVANNQSQEALGYFAEAAYDGDIILDKKAAYSTIAISAELHQRSPSTKTLDTLLSYAQRFVDLYPEDPRSAQIAANAAEQAFSAKRFENAIALANTISDNAPVTVRYDANNLKGRAFLETAQFTDAEAVYRELLDTNRARRKEKQTLESSLALAIYRQGEAARDGSQVDLALNHFTRIANEAPGSPLASTGLYDAIAMTMGAESWNRAIALIQRFNRLYPSDKRQADVAKKLSVAYLNSDQKGKAAQEFEKIARIGGDLETQKAAQWQAAELYESRKQWQDAIRAYRDYAHSYKTPYGQNMEAMYKLVNLYGQVRDPQKRYFWQNEIQRADRKATKSAKTDRTQFIASTTILDLAKQRHQAFSIRRLVEPLASNLKKKKADMQAAVKLYGQASGYGMEEVSTEATNSIGMIYAEFSQALLKSERPSNLNAEEREQYEILLEDQAFPFEEKAIEFFETNVARTREGTFNPSIEQSFTQLTQLFPVRYQRKGKASAIQP